MAAHTKPRKLVPLAAVLSVLAAAAVGGYALAGNHAPELADSHAPETVNLAHTAGASGQLMTVTACLAAGKLTRISVGAAPKCPAKSAPLHWAAQSGPAGASGQHVTLTACLAAGKLTHISVGGAPKCPAKSAPLHWTAQSGPAGASGQHVTLTACLAAGKLTRISVGGAPKCPAKSAPLHWTAQSGPASWPRPVYRPSLSSSPSPGSPPSTSSSPSTDQPGAGPGHDVAEHGADDDQRSADADQHEPGVVGRVLIGPARPVDHPGRPVRSVQQRVEHLCQPRAADDLRELRI